MCGTARSPGSAPTKWEPGWKLQSAGSVLQLATPLKSARALRASLALEVAAAAAADGHACLLTGEGRVRRSSSSRRAAAWLLRPLISMLPPSLGGAPRSLGLSASLDSIRRGAMVRHPLVSKGSCAAAAATLGGTPHLLTPSWAQLRVSWSWVEPGML